MTRGALAAVVSVLCVLPAAAQAPPAPVLVAPANGASVVQPIGLQWSPGQATLTITLPNSAGATVATASRTLTITD